MTISENQNQLMLTACSEIVSELLKATKKENFSPDQINGIRNRVSSKYRLQNQPRLVDIIGAVPEEHKTVLVPFLRAKPVRTASGVAVVAVMCKPHRCPHIAATGNICVYCPGGPDSDFEYSTQSYTGYEPTSMRAIRARYDPYEQASGRIAQLESLGHATDKVEYIIMGGTFMALDSSYRSSFICQLHDALSGSQSAGDVDRAVRAGESSVKKCVGITIETRPDYCQATHLKDLLSYGCTRLEIGVQSVYEDVARDTNRGHTVKAVCETFAKAKDAGYKIVAHMMPDLPNVGWSRDIAQFREFFESPRFRADGLKIYPTLVIRGTGLYELWRAKKYRSYAPDLLVELLARILAAVPPWTRVYRVQRDIPMPLVSSGVESGNIRELVLARLKERGWRCRDVRTREVGIQEVHNRIKPNQIELIRRDYVANGAGWETFLSYEDPQQDILIGLLRLRKSNGFFDLHSVCPNLQSFSEHQNCQIHQSQEDASIFKNNSPAFEHTKKSLTNVNLNLCKENCENLTDNKVLGITKSFEAGECICSVENGLNIVKPIHKDDFACLSTSVDEYSKFDSSLNSDPNIDVLSLSDTRSIIQITGNSHVDSKVNMDTNESFGCTSNESYHVKTGNDENHLKHSTVFTSSPLPTQFEKLPDQSDAEPVKTWTQCVNKSVSFVRELHVYGSVVPVHSRDPTRFQHQGFGVLLMEEAERISREEHRSSVILVIAGVGTRNYYAKLGYTLCGPYMAKSL